METAREQPNIDEPLMSANDSRNTPNPDDQYLKSIKLNAHIFDGGHDLQLFLNWLQQLDKYFTWYPITEPRKVKFAAMKLTGRVI